LVNKLKIVMSVFTGQC